MMRDQDKVVSAAVDEASKTDDLLAIYSGQLRAFTGKVEDRAQEALRETQKLEAVGRLAGGIAHDFNNLLTIILGNVELLNAGTHMPAEMHMINSIERASLRGARLTRQLLNFTRRQAARSEIVDLVKRSKDMTEFLSRSLAGNIRMVVAYPDDLWPIECDFGELELALINLCVNVRDAMPGGGLLRFEGRNLRQLNENVGGVDLVGDFVSLIVTDAGSGIDPAILDRVFEPFFTTKDIGKGSGLGLSQVKGFAIQAGGTVTVTSNIGHGTTVTLYLPRAASIAVPESESHPELVRGAGIVLLVEDDMEVARTAAQILELIGYRSHQVPDARTALAVLLGGQKFDLVLSDIVMPGGMSGLELARKIRKHFPSLPILLTSGYNNAAAAVAEEGFNLIAKPYRADSLANSIQQAVGLATGANRQSA